MSVDLLIKNHTPTPLVIPIMRYLGVRRNGRIVLIELAKLDWIKARGKYVEIHYGKENFLHREPISRLEKRLSGFPFVRIHRSILVNLDRIREIKRIFHGAHVAVLHDGTELEITRTFRGRLLSQFL